MYLAVDCHSSNEVVYDLQYPFLESNEQYEHVARLRQESLVTARESGAEYFFVSCEKKNSQKKSKLFLC